MANKNIIETDRYAQCIEVSKNVRWDIDKDVIRGRNFDYSQKFLPDGISKLNEISFLDSIEKRRLSQIQGRTYANMFGFVERFITAKILELTLDHSLGDQVALEALVRFCDEELKHQELFRRIEAMMAKGMPMGYNFKWDPNEVASAVLEKSTWAVLALTLQIELFTQSHYKESIAPDTALSELYKDIFLFHWKEESTHAIMDELEWPRENSKLTSKERDSSVDQVIELVVDIDGILREQSHADSNYFLSTCERNFSDNEKEKISAQILKAYRWQYIFSGVTHPRFQKMLNELTQESHRQRMTKALETLM